MKTAQRAWRKEVDPNLTVAFDPDLTAAAAHETVP